MTQRSRAAKIARLIVRCRIVFATLVALVLHAQSEPDFRFDLNLLTLPCVVTDSRGAAVTDLQPHEFRVLDNGVPQKVLNVWRDAGLPLTIGVLMDVSASQRGFVPEHRLTVTRFLERLLHPGDRAFVVRVNDKVILESELAGGANGPRQIMLPAIGKPLGEPCATLRGRSLCGETDLWDAVFASARYKLRQFKGSKALVILSDGNDTGSLHGLDEALTEVQRANAVVYAIRYPDPVSGLASQGLLRLSNDTGGLQFDPPQGKLDAVLSRVEADLRTQYVLGVMWDSANSGIPLHQLKVEVTRPGLVVRARREYVASPE